MTDPEAIAAQLVAWAERDAEIGRSAEAVAMVSRLEYLEDRCERLEAELVDRDRRIAALHADNELLRRHPLRVAAARIRKLVRR